MTSDYKKPGKAGVIGSFKQHYPQVLKAVQAFRELGITVTTPVGSDILQEGINFVRFETDHSSYDDATIQSITLHRLFRADFVFVVVPHGYIGKTTCYEVGRLLHAGIPVYFSSHPVDLPIRVPKSHILSLVQLISRIENRDFSPDWPFFSDGLGLFGELEREVIRGKYRNV